MRTAIVIPAYNAAQTLPRVLRRIPGRGVETVAAICIVDDGSGDATAEVAASLARQDARVRVIRLPRNRGYGGAMKRGLAAAIAEGAEEVACLHADGQYAPEELPALLRGLRERDLDLLQGSRIAGGTSLQGGMPLYKYLANRALTTMENRVFGLRMTDYHSGYLVYGARALRAIPFARLSESFDFDLEVIATARALGLAIGERPIPTHYGDEISYLNPVTYGLRALAVMVGYRVGRYHRLAARGHEARPEDGP